MRKTYVIFLVLLLACALSHAADPEPGAKQTFLLQHVESGFDGGNSLGPSFSAAPNSVAENTAFVINPDKTLCLDQNRNRDFTDDPQGQFKPAANGNYDVWWPLDGRAGDPVCRGTVVVANGMNTCCEHSGWRGEVDLSGHRWVFHYGSDGAFYVSPIESTPETIVRLESFITNSFFLLNGALHRFECERKGQDVEVTVFPEPTDQPLCPVNVNGDDVACLITRIKNRECVVPLIQKSAPLPAGTYSNVMVRVYKKGWFSAYAPLTPDPSPSPIPRAATLRMEPGTPATLNTGGPFRLKLTSSQFRTTLHFRCALVGIGGEEYGIDRGRGYETVDRREPPRLTVTRDGGVIMDDAFKFG